MKKFSRIILLCTFIFLASILTLTGCKRKEQIPLSKNAMFFDTIIDIRVYNEADAAYVDACIDLCKDYENRFSRTISSSEIYRLNHSKGNPVTVSDDTLQLIQTGIYYSQLSNGVFDISIAPVTDLWNFKSETPSLPDEAALTSAVASVGYDKILIDGNIVTLQNPDAALDLGGIAKGFIADELKGFLQSKGVKSAMINLGGNVLTLGSKVDGSPFTIGIQKPFSEKGEMAASLEISGQSVVSSGSYERYFELDGNIYHHILNPVTGYPFKSGLSGVTIISDRSAEGDGLSTICFALGYEKGKALIESLPHTEAIFIFDDLSIQTTSGIGTDIPFQKNPA